MPGREGGHWPHLLWTPRLRQCRLSLLQLDMCPSPGLGQHRCGLRPRASAPAPFQPGFRSPLQERPTAQSAALRGSVCPDTAWRWDGLPDRTVPALTPAAGCGQGTVRPRHGTTLAPGLLPRGEACGACCPVHGGAATGAWARRFPGCRGWKGSPAPRSCGPVPAQRLCPIPLASLQRGPASHGQDHAGWPQAASPERAVALSVAETHLRAQTWPRGHLSDAAPAAAWARWAAAALQRPSWALQPVVPPAAGAAWRPRGDTEARGAPDAYSVLPWVTAGSISTPLLPTLVAGTRSRLCHQTGRLRGHLPESSGWGQATWSKRLGLCAPLSLL